MTRATALGLSALSCSLLSLALAGGCGSGSAGGGPRGGDASAEGAAEAGSRPEAGGDAGQDADADAGSDRGDAAEAAAYPAFRPDMAQIHDRGGPVLTAPRFVTVVWTADPDYKAYEALGDAIGATDYWRAAVTEYGVGPATGGGHVEITTPPPASFSVDPGNDEIDAFVVQGVLGAPGNGWPVPDDQTMYLVYVPSTVAILEHGKESCTGNVGWHTETVAGSFAHVVYGAIPERCRDTYVHDIFKNTTEVATHELAEAATDPWCSTHLAYSGFDADHYAWELFQGYQDEVGDMCEYYMTSYYVEPALGVEAQRLWSNAAAAAGKDPCVPPPSGSTYFNVTELSPEPIVTTDPKGKTHRTRGFHVPVGATRTFSIGYYSEAPAAPWTVVAVEGDGFRKVGSPSLALAIDQPTGGNGHLATVTVTAAAAPPAGTEVLLTLVSTQGTAKHYLPVLIGVYP